MMHKDISSEEINELQKITKKGVYRFNNRKKTHAEYLGLAFLKYIIYANVSTWRTNHLNQFKNCPLTKGQRSTAISFLNKQKLVYSSENRKRWFCIKKEKLIDYMKMLEKELGFQ